MLEEIVERVTKKHLKSERDFLITDIRNLKIYGVWNDVFMGKTGLFIDDYMMLMDILKLLRYRQCIIMQKRIKQISLGLSLKHRSN